MAWGAPAPPGATPGSDLIENLGRGDASMFLLPARTLESDAAVALFGALAGNRTLTELHSCHALSDPALQALSAALASNSTLQKLCIGDAAFGDEGATALSEGLVQNVGLTALDASHKGLTALGAAALAGALGSHGALKELRLARNAIGDGGVAWLGGLLPRLTVLQLAECSIGDADTIAGVLRKAGAPSLVELDLSSNPLGGAVAGDGMEFAFPDRSLQRLGEALGSCAALETLKLDSCSLSGSRFAELVSPLLRLSTSLGSLSASGNGAGDAGAEALGQALYSTVQVKAKRAGQPHECHDGSIASNGQSKLAVLTLRSNEIGVVGAQAVAGIEGLAELDLGSNPLTAAALPALFDAEQLAKLGLSGCGLAAQGALPGLEKALGSLKLRTLDLGGNNLGDDALLPLCAAVVAAVDSGNLSLQRLQLGGSATGEAATAALEGAAAKASSAGCELEWQSADEKAKAGGGDAEKAAAELDVVEAKLEEGKIGGE